jgi:hypothetical protein
MTESNLVHMPSSNVPYYTACGIAVAAVKYCEVARQSHDDETDINISCKACQQVLLDTFAKSCVSQVAVELARTDNHLQVEEVVLETPGANARESYEGFQTAFPIQGPNLIVPLGYESLFKVLIDALHHASEGKGKERHATAKPFDQQPTQLIADLLDSNDGMLQQAMKKIVESKRHKTPEHQIAELLGAINYTAGAIIRIKREAKIP